LLLLLWFDAQGHLRNARWTSPAPVRPGFAAMAPRATIGLAMAPGEAAAVLQKPLFSPSRRPPPPVAVTVAAPPDPLANIRLVGVYGSSEGGGIIANVDGKSRRAGVNEKIGDWTVQRIADRSVTFTRGAETRVVELPRPRQAGAPPVAR
jgi:hypothetical protein